MIKGKWKQWFLLALFCTAGMALPLRSIEAIRGRLSEFFAERWERLHLGYVTLSLAVSSPPSAREALSDAEEILRLQTENGALQREVQAMRSTLLEQLHRRESTGEFLIGRILFRPTTQWSHTLWINLGESDNPSDRPPIIAPYSPIVVGNTLVGIVDEVYPHSSCIRLIDDPSVVVAVRAQRTQSAAQHLRPHLEALLDEYDAIAPHIEGLPARETLFQQLSEISEGLLAEEASANLLAKGELQGGRRYRSRGGELLLEGVGFNYDFSDDEGPARDLRSGQPIGRAGEALPLLCTCDLLITTGMDGFFPPGLRVAEVVEIDQLEEGEVAYSLRARPLVRDFDAIEYISVLPPAERGEGRLHPQF